MLAGALASSVCDATPPVADLVFLPPECVTRPNWTAALRYHEQVTASLENARLHFASDVDYWEAQERAARYVLSAWTLADDAWLGANHGERRRREFLGGLKALLGDDAYYKGELPLPVYLWSDNSYRLTCP